MPPECPVTLRASHRIQSLLARFNLLGAAALCVVTVVSSAWLLLAASLALAALGAWQLLIFRNSGVCLHRDDLCFLDWRGRRCDCIRMARLRRIEWRYDYSHGLTRHVHPGLAAIEIQFSRDDGDPDVLLVAYGGRECHEDARRFVQALVSRLCLPRADQPDIRQEDDHRGTLVWERPARDDEWL